MVIDRHVVGWVGEHRLDRLARHQPGERLGFASATTAAVVAGLVNPDGLIEMQIANYLMDLGHTEIGLIAGLTKNNDRAAERVQGVRDALKARGLILKRERLLERPYKISEGRYALRALMERGDPPTAVICSNDMVAFGALGEATRMGIAVPDDLSVVGFDDAEFAQELNPALTTMRVQTVEIGVLAAEYLLDRIGGRQGLERIEVPVSMILRQSTAPPRARKPKFIAG